MKEISLNILDIAQNSVKAGARHIGIHVKEEGPELSFEIVDDGCGMKPDFLRTVTDPFSTTRTTRKVGMGILYLFTFGLLGIGTLVDLIAIVMKPNPYYV